MSPQARRALSKVKVIVSVVRKTAQTSRRLHSFRERGGANRVGVLALLGKSSGQVKHRTTPLWSSSADGFVEVPLDPGRHELELVFDVGWPERCGKIISMLSVVIFIGGVLAKLVYSKFGQQKLHFSGL